MIEQRLQTLHPGVQARADMADGLELLGVEEIPSEHLIRGLQQAVDGPVRVLNPLALFARRRQQRRLDVTAHALHDVRHHFLRRPPSGRVPSERHRRLDELARPRRGAESECDSLLHLLAVMRTSMLAVLAQGLQLGENPRFDVGPPVPGRPAPQAVAGEALPMIVDRVSLGQNFRQLVVGVGPDLLPEGLERHGPNHPGNLPDQVLAVAAAHIDLAVEQVQEVERPGVPAEAILAGPVAAVPHADIRPALVAEELDLVQRRAGRGFELRPEHRIDPERIGQQQVADDLGGLGERLARPPAQVVGHVDEHAGAGSAADAAGDVHRRGAVGGQDELVRLLLDDLLRARAKTAETGRHRLVDDRLAQLEEDQPAEPRNALASVVRERRVLAEPPHPVQMGMEFRETGVVAHDLAGIDMMKQVDEVGENPFGRPAVIRGIRIQLQETDERRNVPEQLADIVLRPLADENPGAAQPDDERRPHDDWTIAQSHSVFPCLLSTNSTSGVVGCAVHTLPSESGGHSPLHMLRLSARHSPDPDRHAHRSIDVVHAVGKVEMHGLDLSLLRQMLRAALAGPHAPAPGPQAGPDAHQSGADGSGITPDARDDRRPGPPAGI